MPIQNLEKIFKPKRIAVIGASPKLGSVGNTVLANLRKGEFKGEVYPVNPKYDEIEGLATFPNVHDIPELVDLAVICTPARTVSEIAIECGTAGILGLIILTAGFREIGDAGSELQRELERAIRLHKGMRVIGPNCLGIIAPHFSLNASFAADMPQTGRIAFISQSGALCTAVLDWALQENVGFSHFVSIGNSMDVGMGDLIDYLSLDPHTDAIILYIESIDNPRSFMSAARAFTRDKPIIAYKAGRFAASAKAAASHTGAMAGVDAVYEAAFKRAGIVRVHEMSDMFDCAELLARNKRPRGSRVAIITNAGGPGVMAVDELLGHHGQLAELSESTIEQLSSFLPNNWSKANPVDVIGDATPQRYSEALRVVLEDEQTDAAIALFAPQAMSQPTESAEALIEIGKNSNKPVLACWMGGKSMQLAVAKLNSAGIPTYSTPERAVRAFEYLDEYTRNREMLYETPKDLEIGFTLDRAKRRELFNTIVREQGKSNVLSEVASKALLSAYDIPVSSTLRAADAEEAVAHAKRLGYPVAMKIMSPQITHKSDVGGVVLNLIHDEAVVAAFKQVTNSARAARPDAVLNGVSIQHMYGHTSGRELIVGAKRDAAFGIVMMVGAGGTSAELLQDRALELPPLNERLAWRMLESLRAWPLLNGYRGAPPVQIERLIEVIIRLSYLVADFPEIQEFDVNPLLATPSEVVALDARIVIAESSLENPPAPFSHLAIRPYPVEYVRAAILQDGQRVLLRPIKPEDEPMWKELLSSCSSESLWFRFQHRFKEATHGMATRFCFLDYDREMAIVVEIEENDQRRIIGVGRLVAEPDHMNAEYAILLADAVQGIGLGALLTDYCMEICNRWGIHEVRAWVSADNRRMLEIFQHRGFAIEHSDAPNVLRVSKHLERATACAELQT